MTNCSQKDKGILLGFVNKQLPLLRNIIILNLLDFVCCLYLNTESTATKMTSYHFTLVDVDCNLLAFVFETFYLPGVKVFNPNLIENAHNNLYLKKLWTANILVAQLFNLFIHLRCTGSPCCKQWCNKLILDWFDEPVCWVFKL